MGGEIWVDLDSRLTHTGSILFEGHYARRAESASEPEPAGTAGA
jgi:hypothetical protein